MGELNALNRPLSDPSSFSSLSLHCPNADSGSMLRIAADHALPMNAVGHERSANFSGRVRNALERASTAPAHWPSPRGDVLGERARTQLAPRRAATSPP